MTNAGYLPAVTAVEVVGEHELRLTFDDGTVGDVSFSDRQWTGVFEPLRDPARFAKVQIDPLFATIVWPEDGLDMAPEPLYENAKRRPPLVDVTHVKVIGEHDLRLTFEDGTVGDVSFGDDEWTGVFAPLRDPVRFAKVQVEGGTIVWPEDGLDMAPEPLYADARRRQVARQP